MSENREPSNRGLIIAAICLVISVGLAFAMVAGVSSTHHGKCPPTNQSSPSRPSGPSCLRLNSVQGSND